MSTAKKLNPKLWEKAKEDVMKDGKKWNARKAQRAVKIYKDLGGKYSSSVKQSETSLNKWTKEDWGYIKNSKRYLPKKVRENLTDKEKKEASDSKKRLGKSYKYPKSLNIKMKKFNIY